MANEFDQNDSMVVRDRGNRVMVAVLSIALALFLGFFLGMGFAALFRLPNFIGVTLGLAFGTLTAFWIALRSYISNPAVTAFVTVDPLVTLLNDKNKSALVTYGPGVHVCYWWEQRSGSNTVNLGEAAETFSVTVQLSKGTLNVKYSVRLRPDITKLSNFLSGVASVATDLGGLINAKIIELLKGKVLTDALMEVETLNELLSIEFKHGAKPVTDFEERFGVINGDITIEEMLPSKEVQETMSSLTESAVIDQIVAQSFGCDDIKALMTAVKSGEIEQSEVNRRRTQTMAMSGNLQGMDLREHTFNLQVQGLKDIDPALIQAITAAGPALAALTGAFATQKGGSQSKKGGK